MYEEILKFLREDVVAKFGIAWLVVILLFAIVIYLIRRALNDKDETIKQLREENKHYRDLFVSSIAPSPVNRNP